MPDSYGPTSAKVTLSVALVCPVDGSSPMRHLELRLAVPDEAIEYGRDTWVKSLNAYIAGCVTEFIEKRRRELRTYATDETQ